MNVLILAAGYATRLYPLTLERPKALLEVGGIPILGRILARLTRVPDLARIYIVSNRRFLRAFETFARAQPARPSLRVLDDGSTCEENRLGAIGDLAFALRAGDLDRAPLLVVAGDNLLEFDLAPHAARFRALGETLLLVRDAVVPAGPSPYNEVELDPEGRLLRFREKPETRRSPLAALAVYFFPPGLQARVDAYLAEGGSPDAPGHLIEWMVARFPVHASRIEGGWFDIGTPEMLARARASLQG